MQAVIVNSNRPTCFNHRTLGYCDKGIKTLNLEFLMHCSAFIRHHYLKIIAFLLFFLVFITVHHHYHTKQYESLIHALQNANILSNNDNIRYNNQNSLKNIITATAASESVKPKVIGSQDVVVKSGDFVTNRLRLPSGKSLTFYTYSNADMISRSVSQYGTWEGGWNKMVHDILVADPDAHFMDIGCNIGIYTMIAADLNRHVLALDANVHNLYRLKQTLISNKMENLVTLVHNALNDKRGKVFMRIIPSNVGGSAITEKEDPTIKPTEVQSILFNDLVSVISFKKAVMKLDLETREYNALLHADILFHTVNITAVMIEWSIPRFAEPQKKGGFVKSFFETRGYKAFRTFSEQTPLSPDFMKWPGDIVWKKS